MTQTIFWRSRWRKIRIVHVVSKEIHPRFRFVCGILTCITIYRSSIQFPHFSWTNQGNNPLGHAFLKIKEMTNFAQSSEGHYNLVFPVYVNNSKVNTQIGRYSSFKMLHITPALNTPRLRIQHEKIV